jgi:hypothetical protein
MRINVAMLIGIVLIVAGGIGLALKGFSYTREDQILDIGPIEATAETQENVAIPVWISGIVLGLGVVILVAGARGRPT